MPNLAAVPDMARDRASDTPQPAGLLAQLREAYDRGYRDGVAAAPRTRHLSLVPALTAGGAA